MLDTRKDKQLFLFLYGKARTGKFFCLNIIIPSLKFISLKSRVNLYKTFVLVMSPTTTSTKHLLYGDCKHGSLRMT